MHEEFCLGPPCRHFPEGTTREEAADIMAARLIATGIEVSYVNKRGERVNACGAPTDDGKTTRYARLPLPFAPLTEGEDK